MKLRLTITVIFLLVMALFTGVGLGYDMKAAEDSGKEPYVSLPVPDAIKYKQVVRTI